MIDAAWTLDVHNWSKGWTLSTYAGKTDTPPLDAAHPVVLEQPYKGSWSWSDYPNGWTPRQATVQVRCLSAAALDAMGGVDPGDLVDAWLYHEQNTIHGVVKKTWHRCLGYLDDPEASQDGRGLVLKLAVVDPLARLSETPVDDANPWPSESLGARLSRIAVAARINIVSLAAYANLATMGPATVNNQGALQLLQSCLAGVQTAAGEQLVLRGTVAELEETGLGDQVLFDTFYVGQPPGLLVDPVSGLSQMYPGVPCYWIDTVGRKSEMDAAYQLTAAHDLISGGGGAGLWVTQRTPVANLYAVEGGAALDAGHVLRDTTTWVKSRSTAINQVKLVGVDAAGEEKSVVAQWSDLVASDGPSTRTVQTARLIDAGAAAAAAGLLPDRATSVPDWTADAFTFTTRGLTLNELHGYSDKLFPAGVQAAGMQIPVAIVGVDPTAALTGPDLSGVLEGATVQVADGGVLSVVGQLRNEVLRPSGTKSNLVSYADLRTKNAAPGTGLPWSTFTYHSDDAVPYLGTDRTWDASQAHPSFGHEQLTYRDLRLIGA